MTLLCSDPFDLMEGGSVANKRLHGPASPSTSPSRRGSAPPCKAGAPFDVMRMTVPMPLDWDEVSPRLDPNVFTIKTAERRMGAKAPWSSFFGHRQTLPRV